ncbi:N-acetylphosphatidylethanolamine-hydrolyzing phospholipase D [Saliniradius amylolyticus]|uniref:N-acetylphosphatidylethanolamine-hydrolyzing phospholipase D n=1 Tax=Saliniradius amylolyticus TaxID=2183582 RepID=A0A2S2E1P4_9ALTE|nr:MBL fold metallo-hydrolase [Saliniradius amylolyticus]AWL11556.1 N-acetylphosphatidylethanolamine-hydrolyzing phospholipase D [Saliniradius amylolyticus]
MQVKLQWWAGVWATVLSLAACASQKDLPTSQHTLIEDGQYTNPQIQDPEKSFFDYWGMRLFGDTEFADQSAQVDRIQTVTNTLDLTVRPSGERVIWLGHSTFLIQAGGLNVLTDPILSERASPVSFAGPVRLAPMPYSFEDLPRIDVVLISHNHYDHLDRATIKQLGNEPHYYVPLGLSEWFKQQDIDGLSITEMDWWQQDTGRGYTITATPAQHWSARSLFDRRETFWAGWHIQIGDWRLWFAGDTGYNPVQFRQIGERLKDIDVALIPIGSYSPRWFMKPYHVNPQEAVRIHQDVGAATSVGMHWSTFQLSAEALDEPRRRLETIMAERPGLPPFITLPIGGHLHWAD